MGDSGMFFPLFEIEGMANDLQAKLQNIFGTDTILTKAKRLVPKLFFPILDAREPTAQNIDFPLVFWNVVLASRHIVLPREWVLYGKRQAKGQGGF